MGGHWSGHNTRSVRFNFVKKFPWKSPLLRNFRYAVVAQGPLANAWVERAALVGARRGCAPQVGKSFILKLLVLSCAQNRLAQNL